MGRRVPLRALVPALALMAIALVGLAGFEVAMRPSQDERQSLILVFAGLAGVTGAAAWALPRWAMRSRSLIGTLALVALASIVLTAAAIAVAAALMFVSARELLLLLVLTGYGVGLGAFLAVSVAVPLARDLLLVRRTAELVARGDLGARTEVERPDEVGQAADAVDSMAAALERMQAERAASTAARQAFLAAVGHDLRSPLHALGAAVEALEDGVAADPRRTYAAIHADLTAIRSLVDDLFLLARLESGSLEFERVPVDLTELADEAIEALAPLAAQRGIRIEFRPTRRVLTRGGPMQLSRAIRNILDNAIKHAPTGTAVVVEAGSHPGRVLVLDEGEGFAYGMPDGAARGGAVRRAVSAMDGTGDTGLGLVIARELVEAHGGRLLIERGPGGRVGIEVPEA